MIKDMHKFLIEVAVKKALQEMEDSPERSIRNLIDLGLENSGGNFQKEFLTAARTMLENEDSRYYDLARDVLSNVERKKLMGFGINIGYNSCTKGAKQIRELEANEGYSIPWILFLTIDEAALKENRERYSDFFTQGEAMGIYTYGLFVQGDPSALLPLLQEHRDCACFLCLHSAQVSDAFLEKMKELSNTVIALIHDGNATVVCEKLRSARLPYALIVHYGEENAQAILDGSCIRSLLPLHPQFIFFRENLDCPPEIRKAVRAYALRTRMNQDYPVLVLEFQQAIERIAEIISANPSLMGFSQMGQLITQHRWEGRGEYNLFTNDLKEILQAYHDAQQGELLPRSQCYETVSEKAQ